MSILGDSRVMAQVVADLDRVPDSWPQSGPALAVVGLLEVNQQVRQDLPLVCVSVSLSLCLLNT